MPVSRSLEPILSSLVGDPDMAELIQLFVDEIPERIQAVQSYWQSKDLDELRRIAHQLKGSGGGYGFSSLGDAAGALEHSLTHTSGDQHDLDGISRQVDELVNLCSRIRVS